MSFHVECECGRSYEVQERKEEAGKLFIESCRNAVDPETYYSSAIGELDAAFAYREMMELSTDHSKRVPGSADAHYYRGYSLRRLDRYGEAEEAFRAGMKIDNSEEQRVYWNEMAFTLAHLGKTDEALEFADRFLGPDEDESAACYGRGGRVRGQGVEGMAGRVHGSVHARVHLLGSQRRGTGA